jgi:hypothetical protein
VSDETDSVDIVLGFGSVRAEMSFSATGVMARKLKLKEGDPVKVTVQRF